MLCSHIFDSVLKNKDFRRVVFTRHNSQLVFMSLKPGEEIGTEKHLADEMDFFVAGAAKAVVGGEERFLEAGDALVVPAKTTHNVVNTGSELLKMYCIYAPSLYRSDTVHTTKDESIVDI